MKLQEIQQQLKVPKNHRNTFGNYNYRNAEDILEAVKPLLGDSVLTLSDEIVNVGERYYVKATASFSDGKLMKDAAVTVTAYAREEETKKGMDGAQISGAASSYARKYALNGLFLIDDTRDADSEDNSEQKAPVASKTAPRATKEEKAAEASTRSGIKDVDKRAIIHHLIALGYTKKQLMDGISQPVLDKTQLALVPEAVPQILDRLAALVEEKNQS